MVHIIMELGASKVFGRSGTHVTGVLVESERCLATVEVHVVFSVSSCTRSEGNLAHHRVIVHRGPRAL